MAQDRPGRFDYYALVLTWSPSYCAIEQARADPRQCREEADHDFVLHGLWPQYERGWPLNCRLKEPPFVPEEVIDSMLDIMPSKGLIIHEYRAHGTCSGLEPGQYFALARDLYERITIPDRFEDPAKRQLLTPEEIEQEFLKSNSWLTPDMLSVSCRNRNLLDVRFCFGRDLFPRRCGVNEQRRECRVGRIGVPNP